MKNWKDGVVNFVSNFKITLITIIFIIIKTFLSQLQLLFK